jgi:tetratricopeptide (TPR) repeat protein
LAVGADRLSNPNTNNEPPAFIKAATKLKNAIAYETTGKYESALMSLDEALAIQPDYIDAWIVKGVIQGKLGKCKEALQCYDKIIQIDPHFADAYRLKAATYTALNQHEKSVECFQKAVDLDPNNLEYRLSLAIAYQRLKRFEDALKVYESAKEQRPTDARIDYYIGLMWGNLADNQKALASFEQALRLKPDFKDALLGKGIILARLNRKEEAKEIADKILQTKSCNEKQETTQAQSENESIRNDFKAAQNRFRNKYASNSG